MSEKVLLNLYFLSIYFLSLLSILSALLFNTSSYSYLKFYFVTWSLQINTICDHFAKNEGAKSCDKIGMIAMTI